MDEQTKRDVARRFARARKRMGMTQWQVADRAGVSEGTINNLENARSIPQSANRAAIVAALGEDVFGDDLATEARNGWPEDVKVFVDVLGQHLAALPADERAAQVRRWMADIVGRG